MSKTTRRAPDPLKRLQRMIHAASEMRSVRGVTADDEYAVPIHLLMQVADELAQSRDNLKVMTKNYERVHGLYLRSVSDQARMAVRR